MMKSILLTGALCFIQLASMGQASRLSIHVFRDQTPSERQTGKILPDCIYSDKLQGQSDGYKGPKGFRFSSLFQLDSKGQTGFWNESLSKRLGIDSIGVCIGYDSKSNQRLIGIDKNQNFVFDKDELEPLEQNESFFFHWIIKSLDEVDFITIDLEIRSRQNNKELSVRTLTRANIEIPVNDSTVLIILNLGVLEPHFFLFDTARAEGRGIEMYFLGEPFQLEGVFFTLRDLDIVQRTIVLEKHPPGFRPYGYKNGYWYDRDSLLRIVNGYDSLSYAVKDSLNKAEAVLLYCWGTWCGPCLAKMEETTALYRSLDKEGVVYMVGVPWLNSRETLGTLKKDLRRHEIPFPQIPQSNKYNKNELIHFWRNMAYPTYILIGRDERIILRTGELEELENMLKTEGL